jgi:hypothetical protein
MKRLVPLGLLLSLVTVVLYGCYVVPAPPPVAGVRPPPPPHVTATPHRRWVYGQGWDG